MTDIIAFLSDFSLQNVALGAALLGISSGVLGSFTMLKQQSLLGDALSHAALPGIALGFIISGSRDLLPIMSGALISAAIAAIFISIIVKRSRIKTDAALGITLSIFFAFGLVLLTLISHQNNAGQAGLNTFLFGQAASILPRDVWAMFAVTGISVLIINIFWKEYKLISFDPQFAASLGFPLFGLELSLTVLISLAIVVGLQMVGVVLMSAMLIAPAVAARQWVDTLEKMVLLSAAIGAFSGVVGAIMSASAQGLATGPLIVIVASIIVFLSLLFAPNRGVVWHAISSYKNNLILRENQVLVDLYKLANEHGDHSYKIEYGMIKSFYRQNPNKLLRLFEEKHYLVPVEHMQEEGKHWALTEEGYSEAENIWSSVGGSK